MLSKDIAKLAGVSRSTVSRVVNNYSNVPEATKRKVEEVIKKYGYVPNGPARNLSGKPNKIIALFITDLFSKENKNTVYDSPTFSEAILYTIDRAQEHGYNVLVSIINEESGFKGVDTLFKSRVISGAIVMGDQISEEEIHHLRKNGFKVALFNQSNKIHSDTKSMILVNTNNRDPIYKAVDVFIRNGHTKIGHITGSCGKFTVQERLQSFKEKLEKENIPYNPDYVAFSSFHQRSGGYDAMKEILDKNPRNYPTAVFVANSIMAFGAIDAMKEYNLKPKEDISIIGYGNTDIIAHSSEFTTVETPIKKAIDMMLESLLKLIEKESLDQYIFNLNEYSFSDRGSVRFM